MAFAGFSPGEAEGLRRGMSRKRSEEALRAYEQKFVEGAVGRGASRESAERVYAQIVGFSGFGFPKAHGAAFGLLAYQSTWLRVHYGPEFLCALLDEQPMGFYIPDALAHDAQRRGIEVLPPDVNRSEVGCEVEGGAVRVGLGYVGGVRRDEVEALVAARRERGGRFASLAELAGSAGAGRPSLERLAWAGACDELAGGDRRRALWDLGIATPGGGLVEPGAQLALPLPLPASPDLRSLSAWERMLADYAGTGMTVAAHPLALLRPSLEEAETPPVTSRDLATLQLGLYQLLQVFLESIVIFLGVELISKRFDQLVRYLEFRFFQFHIRAAKVLYLADLVVVIHGVKQHPAFVRPQQHRVFAVVHGELGNRDVFSFFQRFAEQRVWTSSGLFGNQIIRGLKVNGIYFFIFYEFEDFHCLRGLGLDLLDLFGFDHHIFALAILISLHNLVALHHFVLGGTNELLLHPHFVIAMKHVKGDA